MDVNEAHARREVELANRLLKDREKDHAREIDAQRADRARAIQDLEEEQRNSLKSLEAKSNAQLNNARDHYDKSLNDTTDKYERTLNDERRDHYDRFGRMTNEYAQKSADDKRAIKRQLDDVITSTSYQSANDKNEHNDLVRAMRDNFEHNRQEVEHSYEDKLMAQRQSTKDDIAKAVSSARDTVDSHTRRQADEMGKTKLDYDIRYKMLADQSKASHDDIKAAADAREKQFIDEKVFSERNSATRGTKAIEDIRAKANQSVNELQANQAFFNANKERDYSEAIQQQIRDSQRKEANQAAGFREVEHQLKAKLDDTISTKNTSDELNAKRYREEAYLTGEAARKESNSNTDLFREMSSRNLRDMELRKNAEQEDYRKQLQRSAKDQSLISANEKVMLESEKNHALSEAISNHNKEKQIMIRDYSAQQAATDELRKRQLTEQQEVFQNTVHDVHDKADKQVFQNSRDNQFQLFQAQETLKNRTNELMEKRDADLNYANDTNHERMKRITDAYHRATKETQEHFEDTTQTIRYDNSVQMAKLRGDSDHERRLQMLDLQGKNRVLMANFEARMNQTRDDFNTEMNKQKLEHDKSMRDLVKRTRETIDGERTLKNREMEAKELQWKEKLKLQEDMFKAEIEKLKRSNELALKKS